MGSIAYLALLALALPGVGAFAPAGKQPAVQVPAHARSVTPLALLQNKLAVPRAPVLQRRSSAPLAMEAFKPDVSQAVLGLMAQPIMWWSLYTLKTTGCGLPGGPFGIIGALEGLSYLIVAGFVLASIYSKLTTGSGLPAGRGGLLGLAEGLSFLTAFAGLVVLGFQIVDYGYIPNAVPVEGGVCS